MSGDLPAGTEVGSLHVVAGDATFDVPVTLTAATRSQAKKRLRLMKSPWMADQGRAE